MTKEEKKAKLDEYIDEITQYFDKVMRKRIGGKPEHAFMEWALKKIINMEADIEQLKREKANKKPKMK